MDKLPLRQQIGAMRAYLDGTLLDNREAKAIAESLRELAEWRRLAAALPKPASVGYGFYPNNVVIDYPESKADEWSNHVVATRALLEFKP